MKILLATMMLLICTFAAAAETQDRDVLAAFDGAKGKFYAAYGRALRENPKLAGKVVFDLDIARSGDVTACRVQSSTMRAPDFERQLCDRITQLKLPPRGAPSTETKTLEFFSTL